MVLVLTVGHLLLVAMKIKPIYIMTIIIPHIHNSVSYKNRKIQYLDLLVGNHYDYEANTQRCMPRTCKSPHQALVSPLDFMNPVTLTGNHSVAAWTEEHEINVPVNCLHEYAQCNHFNTGCGNSCDLCEYDPEDVACDQRHVPLSTHRTDTSAAVGDSSSSTSASKADY